MEEEKLKCLYYIKDNRNENIIYIGQTKDFKQRKYQHFGNNKKQKIDAYMFTEGRENFSMNIFEDIDCTNMSDDEILKKEDELIQYYDTINNGFNKLRSGLISKTKENKNIRSKKYRHTDKAKEKRKQYRQLEKYKEYQHEYSQTQKMKDWHRLYYVEHKEEYLERNRQRRLKLKKKHK